MAYCRGEVYVWHDGQYWNCVDITGFHDSGGAWLAGDQTHKMFSTIKELYDHLIGHEEYLKSVWSNVRRARERAAREFNAENGHEPKR